MAGVSLQVTKTISPNTYRATIGKSTRLDGQHPWWLRRPNRATHLIFGRYDVRVHFRPPSRFVPAPPPGSEPAGRVLVGELGPDEFPVLGFDSNVAFRPAQGSEFKIKLMRC